MYVKGIVFLPLLGTISSFFLPKRFTLFTTSLLMCIAGILATYLLFTIEHNYTTIIPLFQWLSVKLPLSWFREQYIDIYWSIRLDMLSAVMLFVVTVISAIVHIYSIGYMAHDRDKERFFTYLSLFTFFMLLLVTAGNFIQLFTGWEGVGLCSYLLIGFWFERESANKASFKAFIVNRIGDVGLILAIALLFYFTSKFDFQGLFTDSVLNVLNQKYMAIAGMRVHVMDLICFLLLIAAMGKSAQIGLHIWLPDAMEGPTPVSALIHAATMVTAGVFLLVRCASLFHLSPIVSHFTLVIGAITAFFAASVALVQRDLKKVIAYSTCSQLGYMFIACGSGYYIGAIFHLFTHAFFKALLFLSAGNIIHALDGEQDMSKMGGLRHEMPFTYIMTWCGALALGGIFPFAGFYSKDFIIASSYNDTFAFASGLIVALLTSVYIWRLLFMVFHNKNTVQEVHKLPKNMTLSLLPLAFGAIASGFLGQRFFHLREEFELPFILQYLPLLLGIAGIGIAYLLYMKTHVTNLKLTFLYTFLTRKWYFDEIYYYFFVRNFARLSNFTARFIEKTIDCIGPNGLARLANNCARYCSSVQTGYLFHYTLCTAMGLIVIISAVLVTMIIKLYL